MNSQINVFHIEDYRVMREGIRMLFSQTEDVRPVAEAPNGNDVLAVLQRERVDVIILDLYLDAMTDLSTPNGFEICNLVRDRFPNVKIVAHSIYDDADRVARVLRSGAMGFVSKKSGFVELLNAIRTVHNGGRYVCTQITNKLRNLSEFLSGFDENLRDHDEAFSRREREVLYLLATGCSSKEIAEKLFINERTVETHRKNMMIKAKVKNTVELIAYASSIGLIRK
jgi:DNA-binding NarL/FixJ family response regulator